MRIVNSPKDAIAKEMYGLFFEDINFGADGGLYAEMIENRSFEARECFGIPGLYYHVEDSGYAWSAVADKDGQKPLLQFVEGTPLSEVNPHYLRLTSANSAQGFANKAYDGITLKKGMNYRVSFYARCLRFEGKGLVVSVEKDNTTYGSLEIELKKAAPYAAFCTVEPSFVSGWTAVDKVTAYRNSINLSEYAKESEWVRYEGVLTAEADVRGAAFVIRPDAPCIIEFDLISMIPEDAVAGVFRRDLFEALDSIHPGFIRFPGGCIVEGISLDNRYRWKRTVGELKDRKYIPNLWAYVDDRDVTEINAQRPDAHYGQSYGIGFYEYFLLCELLGAKPLPVVSVGLACQFRSDEMIGVDDIRLQEYIQDAVDLIEFANGDVNTRWGALRASMGHPAPFNLDMLAVGNEQWEAKDVELFRRTDMFEKAIHEACPEIRLIGTAGPGIDVPMYGQAWNAIRERNKSNPNYCYAVDEHYYVSPEWMFDRIKLYDDYSRDVFVFAGEYAAHTKNLGNNMESALAEAAFLTGIEKNAGVVKLASYAPLFNRIGHSQWKPDMIWFDDKDVYLSPNYYVQKLYANNVGDYTVDMEGFEEELREKKIYVSVTGCCDGNVILKAANCGDADFDLELTDKDGRPILAPADVQVLRAAGAEPENRPQPSKIDRETRELSGSIKLEAGTFTVLKIKLG